MRFSEQLRAQAMDEAGIPEIRYDYEYDFALYNLGVKLPRTGVVLELSASQNGSFRNETKRRHSDVTLITLDPSFADEEFRANYVRHTGEGNGIVAGIAQELPFKENTFDLIVSHCGVPTHLPETDDEIEPHYVAAFKEAYRVLKPGGKAIFSPIFSQDDLVKCFNAIDTFNSTEELMQLTRAQEFPLDQPIPQFAYRLIMAKAQ